MTATVYSVTRLHAAAEEFAEQLPFQLAIVELQDNTRTTVRIIGPSVEIGDEVAQTEDDPNCWKLIHS